MVENTVEVPATTRDICCWDAHEHIFEQLRALAATTETLAETGRAANKNPAIYFDPESVEALLHGIVHVARDLADVHRTYQTTGEWPHRSIWAFNGENIMGGREATEQLG